MPAAVASISGDLRDLDRAYESVQEAIKSIESIPGLVEKLKQKKEQAFPDRATSDDDALLNALEQDAMRFNAMIEKDVKSAEVVPSASSAGKGRRFAYSAEHFTGNPELTPFVALASSMGGDDHLPERNSSEVLNLVGSNSRQIRHLEERPAGVSRGADDKNAQRNRRQRAISADTLRRRHSLTAQVAGGPEVEAAHRLLAERLRGRMPVLRHALRRADAAQSGSLVRDDFFRVLSELQLQLPVDQKEALASACAYSRGGDFSGPQCLVDIDRVVAHVETAISMAEKEEQKLRKENLQAGEKTKDSAVRGREAAERGQDKVLNLLASEGHADPEPVFRLFDPNRSGRVSSGALRQGLRCLGVDVADGDFRTLLKEVGANAGGEVEYRRVVDELVLQHKRSEALKKKQELDVQVESSVPVHFRHSFVVDVLPETARMNISSEERKKKIERQRVVDSVASAGHSRLVKLFASNSGNNKARSNPNEGISELKEISVAEFREGLKTIGVSVSDQDFALISHHVGSSESGRISYEQLCRGINLPPPSKVRSTLLASALDSELYDSKPTDEGGIFYKSAHKLSANPTFAVSSTSLDSMPKGFRGAQQSTRRYSGAPDDALEPQRERIFPLSQLVERDRAARELASARERAVAQTRATEKESASAMAAAVARRQGIKVHDVPATDSGGNAAQEREPFRIGGAVPVASAGTVVDGSAAAASPSKILARSASCDPALRRARTPWAESAPIDSEGVVPKLDNLQLRGVLESEMGRRGRRSFSWRTATASNSIVPQGVNERAGHIGLDCTRRADGNRQNFSFVYTTTAAEPVASRGYSPGRDQVIESAPALRKGDGSSRGRGLSVDRGTFHIKEVSRFGKRVFRDSSPAPGTPKLTEMAAGAPPVCFSKRVFADRLLPWTKREPAEDPSQRFGKRVVFLPYRSSGEGQPKKDVDETVGGGREEKSQQPPSSSLLGGRAQAFVTTGAARFARQQQNKQYEQSNSGSVKAGISGPNSSRGPQRAIHSLADVAASLYRPAAS